MYARMYVFIYLYAIMHECKHARTCIDLYAHVRLCMRRSIDTLL